MKKGDLLFIVGYRGVGKSTLAQKIASQFENVVVSRKYWNLDEHPECNIIEGLMSEMDWGPVARLSRKRRYTREDEFGIPREFPTPAVVGCVQLTEGEQVTGQILKFPVIHLQADGFEMLGNWYGMEQPSIAVSLTADEKWTLDTFAGNAEVTTAVISKAVKRQLRREKAHEAPAAKTAEWMQNFAQARLGDVDVSIQELGKYIGGWTPVAIPRYEDAVKASTIDGLVEGIERAKAEAQAGIAAAQLDVARVKEMNDLAFRVMAAQKSVAAQLITDALQGINVNLKLIQEKAEAEEFSEMVRGYSERINAEREKWDNYRKEEHEKAEKRKAEEFERLCRPLMRFLNEKAHPHCSITITHTSAELVEGLMALRTEEYVRD